MTKEYYNFGVDTEARLHTETTGMTDNKRFQVYKVIGSFHEWSIEDTVDDKIVFGSIMHKYEADRLCECLNNFAEENKELKKRLNNAEKVNIRLIDENHRLRLTIIHSSDLNSDIEWLKENLKEDWNNE